MTRTWKSAWLFSLLGLAVALGSGCDAVPVGAIADLIPDLNGDDGGANGPALAELDTYATNTGGASGLALRPSDGALFAVNGVGLFGPINEGDDLSAMTPIGATNLADADIFDLDTHGTEATRSLSLAITNSGEFWIGSDCCQTLAIVGPQGGDAVPFLGLLSGDIDTSNIKPETLALVPDGFDGPQMKPGNLLASQDTTFSRLAAIDVEADEPTVVNVDNPVAEDINREGHHLTFGLDGTLYSSRALRGLTFAGIQTIDPDGTPAPLPGTLNLSANSFVGLANGDLVIRGARGVVAASPQNGILFYSAADDALTFALGLSTEQRSEDDELVITADGSAVFLSLPNANTIVRVIDTR